MHRSPTHKAASADLKWEMAQCLKQQISWKPLFLQHSHHKKSLNKQWAGGYLFMKAQVQLVGLLWSLWCGCGPYAVVTENPCWLQMKCRFIGTCAFLHLVMLVMFTHSNQHFMQVLLLKLHCPHYLYGFTSHLTSRFEHLTVMWKCKTFFSAR